MADHDTHDHTGVTGVPADAGQSLGTSANPQFATIELGNASDTTLTRASAGVLAVEGKNAYLAGGTDVAVADGGTGASTKAAGFDALQPMTTSGDIIYGGASGAGTRLAKGSDGNVLTLASGVPSWAAAAGGGAWTMIADSLLGSDTATFDFTSISGAYKHLMIFISGRSTKAASSSDFALMRFNNDSSGNYDGEWWQLANGTNSGAEDVGATSFAHCLLPPAASSTAGSVVNGTIWIPDYASATLQKGYITDHFVVLAQSSTNLRRCMGGGGWRSTAAITRVTLLFGADSWKTGSRCTLYGIS